MAWRDARPQRCAEDKWRLDFFCERERPDICLFELMKNKGKLKMMVYIVSRELLAWDMPRLYVLAFCIFIHGLVDAFVIWKWKRWAWDHSLIMANYCSNCHHTSVAALFCILKFKQVNGDEVSMRRRPWGLKKTWYLVSWFTYLCPLGWCKFNAYESVQELVTRRSRRRI